MSRKPRYLLISGIVLVAIALLLIFSPILKSKPIAIEPGFTYQDTITLEDKPDNTDKDYRRHTYSLTTAVNVTWLFEVSSLSDDPIRLIEDHDGKRIQLLTTDAMVSAKTEYKFHSAGLKIYYIEAPAGGLPADYSLKVTKIKEE